MRKHLGWIARLLIAAAGVGYILYTLDWTSRVELPDDSLLAVSQADAEWVTLTEPLESRPGLAVDEGRVRRATLETGDPDLPRFKPSFLVIVREANKPLLLGGLAVFAPAFVIGAMRWWVLMRARGIEISFARTYRLTMAGLFFNLCMPGTTGGDVMKAFYAARGTNQRADAVVSIAIDRICGLVGLVLVVGCIGLLSLDDPLIRKLTISMWAGLAGLMLVAGVYASKTVRAGLRPGKLVGRVPGAGLLRKLDALVAAYRHHLGALAVAIGLSMPLQLALALSMAMAGYALGLGLPLAFLLGAIPIVFVLWSLPVSGPLGLGPLDIVAVQLILAGGEATAQQVVIMFVAFRLYTVAVGLSGSAALVGTGAPSTRMVKDDAEAPGSQAPSQ